MLRWGKVIAGGTRVSQTCLDHSSFPELNCSPASYIPSPVPDLRDAPPLLPRLQERTRRFSPRGEPVLKERLSHWRFGSFRCRAERT